MPEASRCEGRVCLSVVRQNVARVHVVDRNEAGGSGNVVTVTGPDVTVRGVTIRGSGRDLQAMNSGIFLQKTAERATIENARLSGKVAEIEVRFDAFIAAITRNGEGPRASHVTNISFRGWIGPELCAALDPEGVAVSSGSACSAGTAEPSPVLEAMVGRERALSAVRVSLGEDTTTDDIREALVRWQRVLARAATHPRVT